MTEKLKCPICGEATSVWYGNARKDGLCRKHAQELKDNKIQLCKRCSKWHSTKEKCSYENKNKLFKTAKKEKVLSDLTCIICGEDSKGLHFCISCYTKYKNRSVDLRITNCNKTEILDDYGNKQYKTDDGREVRSRAEALIINWLFANKIRVIYEQEVYYKENGQSKTLKPDFYLPDYEIYIEYSEIKTKQYTKSKEYTQKVYQDLNKKVIVMDEDDLKDISACLKPILNIS